jgi:hypothetical protein
MPAITVASHYGQSPIVIMPSADGFVETFQPFWFQEIGRTKMDWERRSAGRMEPVQRLGPGGRITPDVKGRHS